VPNTRRPSLTATALPVTVFVTLDAVGEGFGVGSVGLGEGVADDGALDAGSLARAELAGAALAAAELPGPDETAGGSDDPPAAGPDNASGRGALVGVSLKLSRTTRPATVATKTATKRRTGSPSFWDAID